MLRALKEFFIIVALIVCGLFAVAVFARFNSSDDSTSHDQAANAAGKSVAAASSSVHASSKPSPSAWFPLGKGVYATSPIGKNGLDATDPSSLLLTTDSNTGMPMLLIMIAPAPVCEVGGQDISGEINEVFTYYINNKAVPFRGGCAVGKLLLKPANPKAMEDFMGEFGHITQPIVTITAPDGSERRYMQQGFAAANIALLKASTN